MHIYGGKRSLKIENICGPQNTEWSFIQHLRVGQNTSFAPSALIGFNLLLIIN